MVAHGVPQQPARDAGEAIVQLAQDWHRRFAGDSPGTVGAEVGLRVVHGALALRALEVRGVARDGQLGRAARPSECAAVLRDVFAESHERFGVFSVPADEVDIVSAETLSAYVNTLCSPATTRRIREAPVEALGYAYEQCLGNLRQGGTRKATGVYYTPRAIVERLVEQTVGALLASSPDLEPATLRIVDPACGAAAFLLGVYDRLLAAQLAHLLRLPPSAQRGRLRTARSGLALTSDERRRVLEECIFGVDLDEHALAVARLCLQLRMLDGDEPRQLDLFDGGAPLPALAAQLRVGDSLVGTRTAAVDHAAPTLAPSDNTFSWEEAFPHSRDGFDVVIGNPPWGQKAARVDDAFKQRIRDAYPSSGGIFDWFRPFVELGVRLTRDGGAWGMVLPDIVLLKNYEPTRRLLLDELAMTEIEWVGMAFSGATIDAVTIAGRRVVAAPDHRVHVVVTEPGNDVDHWIRQADFARNPRCAFNLFLTDEMRVCLDRLAGGPRLGDFFEVHEGIHSGNIRSELFVDRAVDGSCGELLFGRDELRPYALRWNGGFVRLSALPDKRTRERYANLGQKRWYEQEKILVRRTGDRITAAVEPHHRYASNNFFLIIAKREHPLSLHGLCALLNSALSTWWFRTVEPRKGRAFAEVKIKHLTALPLPAAECVATCEALNELGAQRAVAMGDRAATLDARIDAAALALFDLESTPQGVPGAKTLPDRRTA